MDVLKAIERVEVDDEDRPKADLVLHKVGDRLGVGGVADGRMSLFA